jgi:hypothetical protein
LKQNKLSFTKLSQYQECGLKYDLHYNQYLRPSKPKSALIFGNSIDEALNVLLETKDLNLAQQKFEDLWNKQLFNKKEISLYTPGNVSFSKADLDEDLLEINNFTIDENIDPAWLSLFMKGELILKTYNDVVLPKIKEVIGIQTPIKIENIEGDSIEGKLDIIIKWEDDRILLMDNKTTSVKYTPESAKESEQLNLYYYIKKDEYKLDAVGFITIDKKVHWEYKKTCKKCKHVFNSNHKTCINTMFGKRCNSEVSIEKIPSININFIINNVDEKIQETTINNFDKLNEGISNNIFEANKNSCYGKFGKCVYFDLCHKNSLEGLEYLEKIEK